MRKAFPLLTLSLALLPSLAQAELYITIVQGLGGMPEYQEEFDTVREKVVAASNTLTTAERVFSFSGDAATREKLLAHFDALNKRLSDGDRAAIYLIGHGSFDGEEYKYNIPGPDLTTGDFKNILETLPGQNHVLITTGSTSGALAEGITGVPAPREPAPGKAAEQPAPTPEDLGPSKYLIVAATRNGNERNATHFGRFFAEALVSTEADINKNETISVQEAYDYATRAVEEYFSDEARLATEHAQLRGEGAAQFSLSRLNSLEYESADPELSDLLTQRQELDSEIEELQLRRGEFASNAEYLQALQALVLRSAELTEQIDQARGVDGAGNAAPAGRTDIEVPRIELNIPPPQAPGLNEALDRRPVEQAPLDRRPPGGDNAQ